MKAFLILSLVGLLALAISDVSADKKTSDVEFNDMFDSPWPPLRGVKADKYKNVFGFPGGFLSSHGRGSGLGAGSKSGHGSGHKPIHSLGTGTHHGSWHGSI